MEDFKAMAKMVIETTAKSQSLIAYCDYIAHIISGKLKTHDSESLLAVVTSPKYDVTPDGVFASTKKTIMVHDRNGKQYRITVEEA
jgi:hypothetical protein